MKNMSGQPSEQNSNWILFKCEVDALFTCMSDAASMDQSIK
jgi:hypothetical protein